MDWAQIQENALGKTKLTALSDLSAVLILSLSVLYRPRYRWTVNGFEPSDTEWNDIEHAISEMENEIMSGMVGMIIPHVLASVIGFDILPCNGASYMREDYPQLYEVIDSIYIIDADNFCVPDLRDRFPLSVGSSFMLGDTGGEIEHTLTNAEMPMHSHTNSPHAHSEITALPTVVTVGAGAPVPSATPSVGSTGLSAISIDNAGGGDAHNNMPPYLALNWAIVAK